MAIPYNYLINRLRLNEHYTSYTYKKEAYDDMLTDIPNRRSMVLTLETYLKSNKITSLALFMINVDNLKTINDRYGHDVGDALIVSAAKHFKNYALNRGFGIARIGGEEFTIIAVNKNADYLIDSLEKFYAYTEEFNENKNDFKIVFSTGVLYTGQINDLNVKRVIKLADEALYESK